MKKYTNSFHDSSVRVTDKTHDRLERLEFVHPRDRSPSDKALIRKVRKVLCGIEGCQCGDWLGRRQ